MAETNLGTGLNTTNFIWSLAEILRGDFKPAEYGRVILPFVVLRRLECVLEPTRDKVMEAAQLLPPTADEGIKEKLLNKASKHLFHNTTKWTLERVKGDTGHLQANMNAYVGGFSNAGRDISRRKRREDCERGVSCRLPRGPRSPE